MSNKNPLTDGWAWLWIALSIVFFMVLPAPLWLEMPFAFAAGWYATYMGRQLKKLYGYCKTALNKWAEQLEAEKKD